MQHIRSLRIALEFEVYGSPENDQNLAFLEKRIRGIHQGFQTGSGRMSEHMKEISSTDSGVIKPKG